MRVTLPAACTTVIALALLVPSASMASPAQDKSSGATITYPRNADARAAVVPLIAIPAGVAVRAAAPIAAREGAKLVTKVVGRKVAKRKVRRAVQDARTIRRRSKKFVRKKWKKWHSATAACVIGGGGAASSTVFHDILVYGPLNLRPFKDYGTDAAAGCGGGLVALGVGRAIFKIR